MHFVAPFESPYTRFELQDLANNQYTMIVADRQNHLVQLDFGRGPTPHLYTLLGCRHSAAIKLVDYEDVILQGFVLVYEYEGRILTSGSTIRSIKPLGI